MPGKIPDVIQGQSNGLFGCFIQFFFRCLKFFFRHPEFPGGKFQFIKILQKTAYRLISVFTDFLNDLFHCRFNLFGTIRAEIQLFQIPDTAGIRTTDDLHTALYSISLRGKIFPILSFYFSAQFQCGKTDQRTDPGYDPEPDHDLHFRPPFFLKMVMNGGP